MVKVDDVLFSAQEAERKWVLSLLLIVVIDMYKMDIVNVLCYDSLSLMYMYIHTISIVILL